MSLLRHFIRKTILSEGIKSPSDLLPGSYVLVELDPAKKISSAKLLVPYPDAPWAKFRSNPEATHTVAARVDWGEQYLKQPCMGAAEVTFANVSKRYLTDAGYPDPEGFAPMLYDIAMEMQGEKGLMCDRDDVSWDAKNVWEKYLTIRDDVKPKLLDTESGSYTDDPSDDCDQTTFMNYAGVYGEDEDESFRSKMIRHWASQVFVKVSGTPVIDELRSKGLLKVVRK